MSRVRRFFSFILFKIIPFFLLLAILWSGYRVVQAVAQQVNDFMLMNGRSPAYAATGTALFVAEQPTGGGASSNTATSDPVAANPTSPVEAGDTVTSMPTAELITPTLTDSPVPTATYTPTDTPTATDTATNPPPSTDTLAPTLVATQTSLAVALAQVFATNTPRGQDNSGFGVLATNTPAALTTQVTLPIQQPTNAATITPSPTLAPTLSPQPVVTLTPRPLPTLLRPAAPDIESGGGTAIPSAVPPLDRHNNDLVNILLLGGDAQATNDGTLRTDTMIILSINRTTNTVALLSLPRDLYVYIPNGTMQRLNVAYFIGENIGWTDGGWGLLRQTIFYNFGINVHYYALVDFSDFEQVVDAVGGVDVAVDCAIEDLPLKGATVPQAARLVDTEGHRVLDVGYYHLSGGEALWYARSRDNSSDFDRGRRQQQILRAIWRKARTTGQLANLPTLWNDVLKVVKTNLTFEDMLGLLPIAINLDPTRIQNFLMTRTYHTTPWQTPSGDYVQLPVYDTMRSLLEDFYTPPTENQIQVGGASIIVRNGTTHSNWDVVAAERLVWDDFRAIAAGAADKTDYQDTLLIDHTGQAKGSSRSDIAKVLNVKSQNVLVQPDPNRQADFEVILGADYNSCTYSVLPVDQGSIVVTPTP